MTLAAIPRSRLHLQFLVANGAEPDVILLRDATLAADVEQAFPGKGTCIGRETRPGPGPFGWPSIFRANRQYYRDVASRIEALGVDRLILFLEGEPLERFICELPSIRTIELWEDGLSHYVDLTSDIWYAARGLVQAAAGFHPHAITRRRMDRSAVLVRDRFERRNLHLPTPGAPASWREEFLLIGSPLVEDRIITSGALLRACQAVAHASPWPVRYLAHPRENRDNGERIAAVAGMIFDSNPAGLIDHVSNFGYRAHGAAVSTGLLDLGRHDRSVFLPALFGLKTMDRVLASWHHNPVRVARDGAELRRFLNALPPEDRQGNEIATCPSRS